MLLTQNVSEPKMFLNKIRSIFCVPDTNFVSATNVARVCRRGNVCVGNNVSPFASTLTCKQQFLPSDWLKTCQLINRKSVGFHHCHVKPHSICFYHNIKDNERNLSQDLLTIENTDPDLKVHALHYANELLVRARLSFQKLLQNRSTYRNNTKKHVWEKSNDAYLLSIRVQTTKKHISIFMFFSTISASKKIFSQSAS